MAKLIIFILTITTFDWQRLYNLIPSLCFFVFYILLKERRKKKKKMFLFTLSFSHECRISLIKSDKYASTVVMKSIQMGLLFALLKRGSCWFGIQHVPIHFWPVIWSDWAGVCCLGCWDKKIVKNLFIPVAVETSGVIGPCSIVLLRRVGGGWYLD